MVDTVNIYFILIKIGYKIYENIIKNLVISLTITFIAQKSTESQSRL